jgi:hypothetical protein
MELASLVPLLLAFSSAFLLGVLAGRRRPPAPRQVQPPSVLSPEQQCDWMSQWFREHGRLQPLVPAPRRHGRHAA